MGNSRVWAHWNHPFEMLFSVQSLVMSNSLWPHGLQHTSLHCPSLSPGVCLNSCPLSQWYHPTISFSVVPLSSCLQSFPASVRWPKYWNFSFSISPSKEYSGLISLRIAWFDLLANPMDSQEISLAPQFEDINYSALSLFYCPALTSVHDYWKNHSFYYTDLCRQINVSAS